MEAELKAIDTVSAYLRDLKATSRSIRGGAFLAVSALFRVLPRPKVTWPLLSQGPRYSESDAPDGANVVSGGPAPSVVILA